MGKDLRRIIRIVEVPIYLLTLAIGCLNEGSTFFGLLLLTISVFRLWTNHITDEHVYKDR
jgi:hypothetical protein